MARHWQHTKEYLNEINSINKVKKEIEAFRYFDEIWLIGKYRGTQLNNTPVSYIKWAIENMKLSSTSKSILRSKLK